MLNKKDIDFWRFNSLSGERIQASIKLFAETGMNAPFANHLPDAETEAIITKDLTSQLALMIYDDVIDATKKVQELVDELMCSAFRQEHYEAILSKAAEIRHLTDDLLDKCWMKEDEDAEKAETTA